MFGSSMILTVGQALDRAREAGLTVRVHAGGEWIRGRVVSSDGHGVVLVADDGDVCVLRPEAVTGVRVPREDVRTGYVPGHPDSAHVPAQPDGEHLRPFAPPDGGRLPEGNLAGQRLTGQLTDRAV